MAALSWDNVLLLQTSFLGDNVLTLPLVVELRRRFPVRKLTIVCQPASRDLLQDHPAIAELIVDDKNVHASFSLKVGRKRIRTRIRQS